MDSNLTKENINRFIDHTNVKPEATEKDIIKLCQEAKEHGFHSVCISPFRTSLAKKELENLKVEIITVVGFPYGFVKTAEKISEAKQAITDGATEIDMVINIGAVKDANWEYVEGEIREIAQSISPIGLKVIMEIGFLTSEELSLACKVAKKAGAAFVKTSTGFGPRTPTPDDIKIMRDAVGPEMGIKASGGIHDFEMAKKMIEAGATRIGTSSALQIIGVEQVQSKQDISNE
jgi:deoxyribose-phosphate aldolase